MDATGQQGIGLLLVWGAYVVFFAAAKQLAGVGGSVLYWATGNARFGAPPPSRSPSSTGGGGGASESGSGPARGRGATGGIQPPK